MMTDSQLYYELQHVRSYRLYEGLLRTAKAVRANNYTVDRRFPFVNRTQVTDVTSVVSTVCLIIRTFAGEYV